MPLARLVYRSRAVTPQTPATLLDLARRARARNRRESLTGIVLHDEGRFLQWLEGPPDGLERVARDIHQDRRHADIAVLCHDRIEARGFAGWDMQLAARDVAAPDWQHEALAAPAPLITALHRAPEKTPALLAWLGPCAAGPLSTAAQLERVVRTAVLPELHRRFVGTATAPAHPLVAELAVLALTGDEAAIVALLRRADMSFPLQTTRLIEPASRELGEMWRQDACREVEVAFALAALLAAARLGAPAAHALSGASRPRVLVAPAPGEPHHMTAGLDAESLWQAGWQPEEAAPTTDAALGAMLAADRFDALDLSLSAAFRRTEAMPALGRSVRAARRASRNRGLVVVVGGRLFHDRPELGAELGADAGLRGAADVAGAILGQLGPGLRQTG